MLRSLTLVLSFFSICSTTVSAEPFSHKNAEFGYRDGHLSVNVERPINEDFYVTGLGHYTSDIESKDEQKAKATILGGGIRTIMTVDEATEFYGGLDLVQSTVTTDESSSINDGRYFYPGIVAGVRISTTSDFEWDLKASHYFSDNTVVYDYLDTTSFNVTGRYFIDQAMSVGLGYVWLKETEGVGFGAEHFTLSFSLYFE